MRDRTSATRVVQLTHELLFSVNLAWVLVWGPRINGHKFFIHRPLVRTLEPPTIIDQVEWSFLLAALILIGLLLVDRFSFVRVLLQTLGGVVALAGFPVLALHSPREFFQNLAYQDRFDFATGWAWCEIGVVLICGLLFYLRKWALPCVVNIILLLLHFGFWSWLTGTYRNLVAEARAYGSVGLGFWISALFFWGFPIFGFFASLAWGAYLNSSLGPAISQPNTPKTPSSTRSTTT